MEKKMKLNEYVESKGFPSNEIPFDYDKRNDLHLYPIGRAILEWIKEERREKATKLAAWKLAYYCEVYRNKKTDKEAREIADKFVAKKFN